jgi:hypothetical protein
MISSLRSVLLSVVSLLCLSSLSYTATSELLYTLSSNNLTTYSVNKTTAVTTVLGRTKLPPAYRAQIFHAPHAPFLYVLGFLSDNTENLWTYKLNASGVPVGGPRQKIQVKNALTQFVIHPSGKFAFAMYQWIAYDPDIGDYGYVGDITLFTINSSTGMLTNTRKAVVNFPINGYFRPAMAGLNTQGTLMYTTLWPDSFDDSIYHMRSAVNTTTGTVTPPTQYFADDQSSAEGISALSDLFIGRSTGIGGGGSHIDVWTNSGSPSAVVHCDPSMLLLCGDYNDGLLFDPTGKYLLFNDTATNETPITYVSAPRAQLIASGASIPGTPYITVFSPSGVLLYAAESGGVLVYVFNPHTGLLTARTTIAATGVDQLLPVK